MEEVVSTSIEAVHNSLASLGALGNPIGIVAAILASVMLPVSGILVFLTIIYGVHSAVFSVVEFLASAFSVNDQVKTLMVIMGFAV